MGEARLSGRGRIAFVAARRKGRPKDDADPFHGVGCVLQEKIVVVGIGAIERIGQPESPATHDPYLAGFIKALALCPTQCGSFVKFYFLVGSVRRRRTLVPDKQHGLREPQLPRAQ